MCFDFGLAFRKNKTDPLKWPNKIDGLPQSRNIVCLLAPGTAVRRFDLRKSQCTLLATVSVVCYFHSKRNRIGIYIYRKCTRTLVLRYALTVSVRFEKFALTTRTVRDTRGSKLADRKYTQDEFNATRIFGSYVQYSTLIKI